MAQQHSELYPYRQDFSAVEPDLVATGGADPVSLIPDQRSNASVMQAPEFKVLYLGRQGTKVRAAKGRLVVQGPGREVLLSVPQRTVSRVLCFGAVALTTGARSWALQRDVDVVFATRRGKFLGSLVPGKQPQHIDRLRAQCAFEGSAAALVLAQQIVSAKIAKQLVLLKRFAGSQTGPVGEAIAQLGNAQRSVADCASVPELMGVEDAAARAYFPVYGSFFPPGLQFQYRTRRPPKDPVNAVLSCLYVVLYGECVTAVRAAGLEPGFGVLHSAQVGRQSLALDLMEEFRPLIVDQVVLTAARRNQLAHEFISVDSRGFTLTRKGRSAVLDAYEKRMLQSTQSALPGFAGSWRRHLYRQAQRLGCSITQGVEWSGLLWRP